MSIIEPEKAPRLVARTEYAVTELVDRESLPEEFFSRDALREAADSAGKRR
jgi:hypothetical protein